MMQVDTERGQGTTVVFRDVLRLIAETPEPEACIRALLESAQRVTAAAGTHFVLFEQPRLHVSTGAVTTPAENALRTLAMALEKGLHVNPELPEKTGSGTPVWLAAPIHVHNLPVALLWVACHEMPTAAAQNALEALIDGLTIVTQTARLKEHDDDTRHLMASLLNSISDPLLVLDNNKHLLLMNPAAELVFQMDSAVASSKTLREVVNSDDLTDFAEGRKDRLDEWSINDQYFVPRVQVVHDAHGHTEGWILALRDVTRFKKLNRNQVEFVRIVAHDLRSPLTAMQGFASMLSMVGQLNEKQAHFVDRILSGITQMTALVENIQDAGRYDPENGFYEMSRAQCDLIAMVDKLVKEHLVPAEKQELSISVVTSDNVPIIYADTHMLERAIINLLDNAIKYTPNGAKIEVGVRMDGDQIVVSVKDSGYGISPENQKHLFERHHRIPRQEHKKIKGTGLGLFIVRSVARRHGGDAWVESVEGHGATFKIGLPLEGNLSSGEVSAD
ncbi:MAG: GHKL domain-containing protein [Chloroflexi bacterium]|nr:GHKL domain-containing protein [Chloroflexota bacterium]